MALKKPFPTYTQKDDSKLKQLVKAFNKKVSDFSHLSFTPDKIKYSDLKSQIKTRKDYNVIYGIYSRYLKPGSEKSVINSAGVKVSRWLRNELTYGIMRVNAKRRKTIIERDISTERGTMGTIEDNNLRPRNNPKDTLRSRKQFEKVFNSTLRESLSNFADEKAERYKQNYLKMLKNNFEDIEGYNELVAIIESKSASELVDAYYIDPVLQLSFFYDPKEKEEIMGFALEHWREYENQ